MTDLANPALATGAPAPDSVDPHLIDESVALVRRWLCEASAIPTDASGTQLAGVLKDPSGLDFTVGFVDGVVRPEDTRVAAAALRSIAGRVPRFLPAPMRGAVALGGVVAPLLPDVVVPIARRVLRRMVGHLIIDATDSRLGPAIAAIRRDGVRLNMNLLGEAVLGCAEAQRRLEGTHRLLARDDVDYVSIKVSSSVAPHNPWAFEAAVEDIVEELAPLFARAASSTPAKFINLDMEEYKDLDLTIAVFTRILDRAEFADLEAGIVLQAYLPDALSAMIRLQEWSAARRARGGAGIKVRLVKGANLPMEQVEASVHGWPLATWSTKQDSDTNYKRVIDYALHPERIRNVRVGVAGHNLFDVAYSWLLAGTRGVREGMEYEMLLGMAQGQAEAVRRTVGSLLLYTPVVAPAEFDVAIAYLIRRLEEGASSQNFMSAVFELEADPALFAREEERFRASVSALDRAVPSAHRVPERFAAAGRPGFGDFRSTPDTDPSVAVNREWAQAILARVPESRAGVDAIEAATITTRDELEQALAVTRASGWSDVSADERARILHRAGDELEARRAELLEVMAAEGGKTLDQGDPEVSEAIDFAHYYAERARELDAIDGARFHPAALTLVAPPWNFPVAIPAGGTLAALAAGSAVVLKPAGPTARCGAVVAEALWAAGVPREALRLLRLPEDDLGRHLIASSAVDRVILTGAYETAELFRSFRHDLPLLAETSGKNAIIVTPSADLDLAVKDVVASAFGHAGQKCSAASLVVLVGSVARSKRFRAQLLDAVASLTVGYPTDPASRMGPVIEPAAGKLLRGLTMLGADETWLLEPRRLDGSGRLWSPGVRDGVRRGSDFHRVEYFGPILGIMTAPTLDEAIALVNEVEYGLTSGLHALDPAEIGTWLEGIHAGNLSVNRGITGAIVQRQPFGGWKKSAVGPGTKAGGPDYLLGLGSWSAVPAKATAPVPPSASRLVAAALAELSAQESATVERTARSCAAAWAEHIGSSRDVTGLEAERNVFRHLPYDSAVLVRLAVGEPVGSLVRVAVAAATAQARVVLSSASALPPQLAEALGAAATMVIVEDDIAWEARVRAHGAGRIRLLGADAASITAATGGRPDLAVYAGEATEAGRLELLPFVREQAVSITAHRFGTPNHLTDALL
ncbi:bifunctional proline dehydrogenase/L-glutamate gamma-semialdehyde dehydrogenase [Rathayibacter iranicus]|uniref:L-glutamate gamma-semialdehyde dehydrogenase n=2 Tax=Rathayibacter iranicus TaxID=59737 RepID=A0AAD1EMN4_9MICO|nr:bifunctional proline dehydrogenase/L-glutamate gamma-semialdehyde dehydrogenase [Rathayibacter iranicus]AZZ56322.1 1-pyrroline-5-carboxylate dehydrogenase [Rathayibacter iranicus]MWV32147.1 aldehyde dehydrogenase family protein [Rathayibacter iranicus NCPPB 2253 = VKM Ac-1602]PPI45525.1 1-pyrroline-5-carboxylate dehydrogenase [Rathayibacter iranicus]PPI59345.1 1-pyrroline-5-carboxylate dehydrogenase [Rathayibacter iranicus]PPI70632.1 1-pyrroline-5-carboxylate dehydrogenase [Rathayibacter ir